ncbi:MULTISPECIES: tRNA (adenosine(37)-N6)-threonylcarbamoyltransferase complex dimerization subunit type 1 TsaB [Rhizobium]|uniref:tRNA (Adenosine(37)-N6)-threonylcarbamoyltransferase complex dimerization subunit type 1 TsaB n=1 Tax=Rhizobium tropici TaxID=398 RepID=A0A329YCJ9_RHITR|nr:MULTISPECIES: tRNA (adenosine(37)-N6)-threonylcarbamoyltransferase complex dimerization subunit type 1 TsaB [Rhizobium]MBB3287434.1 N6-L-threonylcarbamoyladenine synthase [Rhizobium sp. BK252]MBB3402174.1 N6-L-threonylcarbamoyladenine synthase [Rhizobium sp. BK289]MBB3414751.1 N6-L-threonylcarbamoyladenine synthase [Rhizobium sp. BK284]MBB3482640.1 N6-L-threonylcarbamoyladenine synthase [Rhizobium sp. BK347]MDK4721717.1 tRNA (adenosine(37)-N6)-threonylcarbamoyltransferase complex dimerizati
MIVLALDTAGVDCAAAVYDSGSDSVMGEVTETIGRGHAEHLMHVVDEALAKAGTALSAIERVVVTVGPGSFTGIRIGVAAARGFALSLNVPAIGVTTLEVMAATARAQNPGKSVLAAIDAKREEIYLQSFAADGNPLDEARAVTIDEARAIAGAFDGMVTGTAVARLSDAPPAERPDAFPIATVARLGAGKPAGEKPKPLYLRGPDARPQAGYAIARQ